jgi:hypothetical protein
VKFIIVALLISPFALIKGCREIPSRCGEIINVGGCDRNGRCGVRVKDPVNYRIYNGTDSFPVEGDHTCLTYTAIIYFRWEEMP